MFDAVTRRAKQTSAKPMCFFRYYTLKVLMPAQGRQCLLETPDIVKRLCYRYGIGTVNAQEVNPTNPAQPTFAAFRGRRQRLGG